MVAPTKDSDLLYLRSRVARRHKEYCCFIRKNSCVPMQREEKSESRMVTDDNENIDNKDLFE